MTHQRWLELMRFPKQWSEWGLIPEELAVLQVAGYAPGHEASPEHGRHGAFQWWLRRQPPKEMLIQLARLTWLDPDPQMGAYVRDCISVQSGGDRDVEDALVHAYEP